MNILIAGVTDTKLEQAKRLREEAEKRGHYIEFTLPSRLQILIGPKNKRFKLQGLKKPISKFDIIYAWTISPRRKKDWFLFLDYLHFKYGISVIYDKYVDLLYRKYLTPTYDYVIQKKAKIRFPKSVVFYNKAGALWAIKKIKLPAILKINAIGMMSKGRGVRLVKTKKDLLDIVLEYKKLANRFILRQFIPNDGDIRVFIVGYKAIGAMYRHPKQGDFRSNISQGGYGEVFDLKQNIKVKKIAEKVAKLLRAEIAGVDVMLHKITGKPYILEVNHGPQFTGLEHYTKINAAKKIIEYFEKKRKKDLAKRFLEKAKLNIIKGMGGNVEKVV